MTTPPPEDSGHGGPHPPTASFESIARDTSWPTLATTYRGVPIRMILMVRMDGTTEVMAEFISPVDGKPRSEWWPAEATEPSAMFERAGEKMRRRVDDLIAGMGWSIAPGDPLAVLADDLLGSPPTKPARAPDREWDPRYDIGHAAIDAQHRLLVGLIGKVARLARGNPDEGEIACALLELRKFAEYHFLCEENLMRELCYPRARDHAQIHADMLGELSARTARARQAPRELEHVHGFLVRWVVSHIAHEDRRLAEFLRAESPAKETMDSRPGG